MPPFSQHPADSHDLIRVQGARENNLKDISIAIPKRRLTVFTQPLTPLSGGERQRLKLATHIGADGGVYVLDEPTSGLHLADIAQLLGLLDRQVDSGKSVIVIEHHQAVMARAQWIIDLGPGVGHDGGRIVFEGTPAALIAGRSTLTGEHLAAFVGSRVSSSAPDAIQPGCDTAAA